MLLYGPSTKSSGPIPFTWDSRFNLVLLIAVPFYKTRFQHPMDIAIEGRCTQADSILGELPDLLRDRITVFWLMHNAGKYPHFLLALAAAAAWFFLRRIRAIRRQNRVDSA